MYKLTVYIPESHLEQVKDALFAAGAGRYKNYDRVCWETKGHGQFRPLENSQPHIGQLNRLERVEEYLVEMICDDQYLTAALQALKDTHPYEEPAFAAWEIMTK
ncbi:MAG: NGG1p interacting factor NIF3 [Coxiella sp. (in: Bacteria)]|nr:MAG: NGG1p interacting factor NIF3 [Coxiella sp. (in: g-proteobacteria)]